jgi:hypothetical protein
MQHKLIKTENYLLVVDESGIKAGDFYLLIPENIVKLSRSGLPINIREWEKIIAHLPLNNSPILEGVHLLPPLEDEVEKLARTYTVNTPDNDPVRIYAFIAGYNKAKEKYKYTEEDMKKAIRMCKGEFTKAIVYTQEQIIQSLQQPKMPVAFESEMKCGRCHKPLEEKDDCWSAKECCQGSNSYPDLLKTITNSQGQTQLVGTYIYE